MKEFYIGQLRTDDEIQDFFMVKAIAIKIGSNKNNIWICQYAIRRVS